MAFKPFDVAYSKLIFSAQFHNAKYVINQPLAAKLFSLKVARSRKPSALTQRRELVFDKIMPSYRTAMLLEKTKSINWLGMLAGVKL